MLGESTGDGGVVWSDLPLIKVTFRERFNIQLPRDEGSLCEIFSCALDGLYFLLNVEREENELEMWVERKGNGEVKKILEFWDLHETWRVNFLYVRSKSEEG
ncbi:hypothetical protein VNO77_39309 [Canavalia gladiata]|uniref:Uncharacterized protein n=1 Tax=Canavalia gladiata TaxID=3824 RepID=A0AAN9KBY7_CANGL